MSEQTELRSLMTEAHATLRDIRQAVNAAKSEHAALSRTLAQTAAGEVQRAIRDQVPDEIAKFFDSNAARNLMMKQIKDLMRPALEDVATTTGRDLRKIDTAFETFVSKELTELWESHLKKAIADLSRELANRLDPSETAGES
jgi:hypothetical protein